MPYDKDSVLSYSKREAMETQLTDLSQLKITHHDDGRRPVPRRGPGKAGWIAVAVALIIVSVFASRLLVAPPAAVEVAIVSTVNPDQPTVVLIATGYAVAQRRAAVASKGTGRLVELNVREGDRIKKGAVIGRLESADMSAVLARAQANRNVAESVLDEARAELTDATLSYERKKSLIASGMIPQADFESAEARYRRALAVVASGEAGVKAAGAAVRSAEVDLENTIIRAPFDGTVLTKNADVGEVVAPFGSAVSAKAAVVTMADMDSLEVEADVSESTIEKIRVGQRCEITLDAYPETKYDGIVEAVVPTVDRAKATVLTKVRFLNRDDRVLPEMSARVAFLSGPASVANQRPVIAVPPSAVVARGERRIVFAVRGDRAEEKPVEAGGAVGNLVEIQSGLQPGDRVVLNPPEGLHGGDRIRIKTP
ncbi:MAG TPA: efflux RND transporter periplasmic adaptor subunit [Nitrospiria bacterium]|nr:efflux RND transporter periplasmic adaptor subunit [Nitrospiria bacterium]